MKKVEEKTNVMRILDQKKIPYNYYSYVLSNAISGVEVADYLGEEYNKVFKTLVTISKSGKNYVFMIPVDRELDLKKAANIVNEKSIEMVKSKDLLMLTGYIHGGCSPIGMKKYFDIVIDSEAKNHESIIFSGGKIGYQVELTLDNLSKVISYKLGDITNL